MKITKKVSDLLNEQFYNELYAAHIYFAMSASLRHSPYQGMSKWMRLQAKEEMEHAMKIYEYLIERGAEFKSDSIKKPECDSYGSPLEIFKAAYAHEQKVTAQIEKICDAADEDKDRATSDFLGSPGKWLDDPGNTIAASVVPAVTEALSALGVCVISPRMRFPFSARRLRRKRAARDKFREITDSNFRQAGQKRRPETVYALMEQAV